MHKMTPSFVASALATSLALATFFPLAAHAASTATAPLVQEAPLRAHLAFLSNDLLDSTPRQLYLQQVLGLLQPTYLHVPVVVNSVGEKLSKQTGAQAFDTGAAPEVLLTQALLPAARFLGMELTAASIDDFWRQAVPAWENMLMDTCAGMR